MDLINISVPDSTCSALATYPRLVKYWSGVRKKSVRNTTLFGTIILSEIDPSLSESGQGEREAETQIINTEYERFAEISTMKSK